MSHFHFVLLMHFIRRTLIIYFSTVLLCPFSVSSHDLPYITLNSIILQKRGISYVFKLKLKKTFIVSKSVSLVCLLLLLLHVKRFIILVR